MAFTAELFSYHQWILRPVASTGFYVNKYLGPLTNPFSTPLHLQITWHGEIDKDFTMGNWKQLGFYEAVKNFIQLATHWSGCLQAKSDPWLLQVLHTALSHYKNLHFNRVYSRKHLMGLFC